MGEDQQGLAAQGQQQGGQAQQLSVSQVIQLLMQGYKPEDLIAAGVPQALIEQAIQQLMSQQQGQQAQGQQQQPEGLAGSAMNDTQSQLPPQ